jgi:FtsP/CotA-like multicopper oxidase with cupredoxin domain
MTDLSRRNALRLAGLGAVTTAAGAVGAWRTTGDPGGQTAGVSGGALVEPRVLTSSGGRLDVDLVADRGVRIAGRDTEAFGYNGSSPGPTIRVRPGDTLRVRLTNRLDQATNLHTHGLHVSPEGKSDNIFRSVEPGTTADYEFRIPGDHPAGTFWYHPHLHGTVADQIFGGLFGALIVTHDEEPEVPERLLIISDISLASSGAPAAPGMQAIMMGREGDLVLVNGQHQPLIDVRAGAVERWRVINACVSRFLRLQLDGHDLGLLGYDGQALGEPIPEESVTLAPGNRVDLVVTAPADGEATLRTLAVDRGGMGMMGGTSGATKLAQVRVATSETSPSAGPSQLTWAKSPVVDLRGRDVDETRRITFTMEMGMGMRAGNTSFGFDGRPFDGNRVDQTPRLGTIEEWTIANTTPMDHPFHLHVWPMQVVAPESDAAPDGRPDWRDVVMVPANGEVRVRIAFDDFPGRTVYHCHILDHEDRGMMAIVQAAQ